mmetsp:Transcript_47370/g.118322  ORF Transcript_47370/g.118322 Transcript_47370/m.118322 type:complete len:379 (-) Transcript_47370:48-1184(-)
MVLPLQHGSWYMTWLQASPGRQSSVALVSCKNESVSLFRASSSWLRPASVSRRDLSSSSDFSAFSAYSSLTSYSSCRQCSSCPISRHVTFISRSSSAFVLLTKIDACLTSSLCVLSSAATISSTAASSFMAQECATLSIIVIVVCRQQVLVEEGANVLQKVLLETNQLPHVCNVRLLRRVVLALTRIGATPRTPQRHHSHHRPILPSLRRVAGHPVATAILSAMLGLVLVNQLHDLPRHIPTGALDRLQEGRPVGVRDGRSLANGRPVTQLGQCGTRCMRGEAGGAALQCCCSPSSVGVLVAVCDIHHSESERPRKGVSATPMSVPDQSGLPCAGGQCSDDREAQVNEKARPLRLSTRRGPRRTGSPSGFKRCTQAYD